MMVSFRVNENDIVLYIMDDQREQQKKIKQYLQEYAYMLEEDVLEESQNIFYLEKLKEQISKEILEGLIIICFKINNQLLELYLNEMKPFNNYNILY
ncbi:unnamed protein product [Paramecium octaurelia]|uniref:Uncharacterized protein n=1 Tax=Paramecium octaurelia TaxID=43137 RepID=A0A8S1U0R5_PAROT|nr:unnamed protein product [Paramecium octaurelia]